MININVIENETKEIVKDIINQSELNENDIFVIGLSTSEVVGGKIGQASSKEIGNIIIKTIFKELVKNKVNIAVQACEHLNRALLVEKEVAKRNNFEIVNVIPQIHAGGAGQVAAYNLLNDPVEIEHISADAGIDIGDTEIGMHIKHVQIPIRPNKNKIGFAHVTGLKHRPKKIGGDRAKYIIN